MALEKYKIPPNDRIELRFSGTYYFVHRLDMYFSHQGFTFPIFSDEFYESFEYYILPFQRWTALHIFAEFFINQLLHENEMQALDGKYVRHGECTDRYATHRPVWLLSVDLLENHGYDISILAEEFDSWHERNPRCCPDSSSWTRQPNFDLLTDFVEDGTYAELVEKLAEEVFFVLFGNRSFLHKFHGYIAGWIVEAGAELEASENHLFRADAKSATLKRVKIPEWSKRAVFFRDRGRCSLCERDLNGTQSPINRAEYDHIVPLARGGLNDVSNLQLLCRECNNEKRVADVEPGRTYERWFPTEKSIGYRFASD
ncbi:HNH endonuclease [Amycolatopsis nivea]